MAKHTCMAAASQSRFASNKKSTIHSWAKSMLHKILIHLLILFLIYITLFLTARQELSIIITIKQEKVKMSFLPQEPKSYVQLVTSIDHIYSNKWIPLTTCKIKQKDLVHRDLTYFYFIYQIVWKILSFIIYLKNMVIYYQQELWLRKMVNQRA